ncbi:BEL1-like homeodomain protein 8 [Salvia divinorum]|uniref:BEL1-like homeodomain protein 8 n=1 Tax=Salvia divinorum TaxID=28513 RepID=A0ABD1GF18_SALDI
MNSYRPELHIAQQSRRDKLRIQQDIYANNFPTDVSTSRICYDPSDFSSDQMISFSANPMEPEKRLPFPAPFTPSVADIGGDWAANHASVYNPNPISALDVKPNYLGYDQLELNGASSLYQNALQDFVTSSNDVRSFGLEFASLRQWSGGGELGFADRFSTQALSLSLSSVPPPKVHEIQTNVQDSRTWKPELVSPNQNMPTGGRVLGTHRSPGPLGPFTGYATILRSSRFLRPAQQMLEEFCCFSGPKDVEICDVSDDIFEEARVSGEGATNNAEHAMVTGDNSGGVCSFVFDDSTREAKGTSCSSEPRRPENLQRKAKLLIMQDEVCKRYKQYQQQIQMVVSSFESVAGLSAATPYVSLALNMIAKHFRSLKNAITDQLRSVKEAVRDEFSSPSAGNKGDANASVLKFFEHRKGLEGQHIWRPQRGLPERAVSVLRAWLFDHFLHPYPTDTDKHTLATQTGLTRNQVSNWFINARVRVWKPMVEEIHMLETKANDNAGKSSNGKSVVEGCNESGQSSNQLRMRAIPDKQVECSGFNPPGQEGDRPKASMWTSQEKRSRIEYHVPGSVDGSLMEFVPSLRNGVEMGSVSLTLGLRQSPEGGQERHMRHYGGQIIGDFVG